MSTVYVNRNTVSGNVISVSLSQESPGQEQLASDAPAVLSFLQVISTPTMAGYFQALNTPPPFQVSAGQLIKALYGTGGLAQVDAAVALADPLTQRLWARAPFFVRSDPLVTAIAQAIGKTSAEIDNLFRLAASL